jgi:hypothetical protein
MTRVMCSRTERAGCRSTRRSSVNHRVRLASVPGMKFLTDRIAMPLLQIEPIRNLLVNAFMKRSSQLGVNYRDSPLSENCGNAGKGPEAGDRAPDGQPVGTISNYCPRATTPFNRDYHGETPEGEQLPVLNGSRATRTASITGGPVSCIRPWRQQPTRPDLADLGRVGRDTERPWRNSGLSLARLRIGPVFRSSAAPDT